MRIEPVYVCSFMIISTVFLTGAIRKEYDPILDTQTDGISLKQKLEETKDGEKGAPTPSFKFYERADFQTKSPVGTNPEEFMGAWKDQIPDKGQAIPEQGSGWTENEGWWTEDWSAPSKEKREDEEAWSSSWDSF